MGVGATADSGGLAEEWLTRVHMLLFCYLNMYLWTCICVIVKLYLCMCQNVSVKYFQMDIPIRLWRDTTFLDEYLNSEVNTCTVLNVFEYICILECRLSSWSCCPHQTRLCNSSTQACTVDKFQNSTRVSKHWLPHFAGFQRRHYQESFHHSLWLHSQVIFLSGANINLRHSSITLGPDQHADVKCLQKILGSQTTPMGNK